MPLPQAGHGAIYAIELDPVGAPGVFTAIGELTSEAGPSFNRPASDGTAHNRDIDVYVPGVLMRDTWKFDFSYIFGDLGHEALKGFMFDGTTFGCKFIGPGNLGVTIASGFLIAYNETNPPKEGIRKVSSEFRPSGPMIVDGVAIGTAV